MYEFRAKTPTQYDFMSKVSPCRFEAKSSRKMDSSSPQKGVSFLSPHLLFLRPSLPPPRSHLPCFPIKREETWDPAAILMRSCFAWLVITEWFSPLLVEDVFCFFEHKWVFRTDMNVFFDWAGKGVQAGHRVGSALSLLISVSVLLMYNYPSKFAGQIHLWDKRGGRGDERWMG